MAGQAAFSCPGGGLPGVGVSSGDKASAWGVGVVDPDDSEAETAYFQHAPKLDALSSGRI